MRKIVRRDRRRLLGNITALVAAQTVFGIGRSHAQSWPDRPITLVVNSDVGGSADRMARGLAPFLAARLDNPVGVINKPGAGGALGYLYLLDQKNDGHTLFAGTFAPVISITMATGVGKYKLEDFAFMNANWSDWDIVAANKTTPYKTLPELLTTIRDKPGTVRGCVVAESAGHLTVLMLLQKAGIPLQNLNLVTYAGGGEARTAIAGGQVDFIVIAGDGSDGIRDFLHPLAVVRANRVSTWDAPPIAEALQPMGLDVPAISGAMRGLMSVASFKENHPDRWTRIMDAYKATVESEEFRKYARDNKMGSDWLGPERTTEEVMRTHEIVQQYASLLKR